jgi:L-alanine-DL-glutamate epimerase-like enolase superfamily enzyme
VAKHVKAMCSPSAQINDVRVAAYRVPTETPESDGTFEWDATTLVTVHISAGGRRGFGYSYADSATAELIRSTFVPLLAGKDASSVERLWADMIHAVRNLGRRGIAAMAISAVDAALWDLKAKLLGLPLLAVRGHVREAAPVYGSGGFTSYSLAELQRQLGRWASSGIPRVKMKIGRDAAADIERVRAAREATRTRLRALHRRERRLHGEASSTKRL